MQELRTDASAAMDLTDLSLGAFEKPAIYPLALIERKRRDHTGQDTCVSHIVGIRKTSSVKLNVASFPVSEAGIGLVEQLVGNMGVLIPGWDQAFGLSQFPCNNLQRHDQHHVMG